MERNMVGFYIDGKYYKNPDDAPQHKIARVATQVVNYDLEKASEKHDMELIQPYLADGKPNPEFAKYYPELAKEYNMEELL